MLFSLMTLTLTIIPLPPNPTPLKDPLPPSPPEPFSEILSGKPAMQLPTRPPTLFSPSSVTFSNPTGRGPNNPVSGPTCHLSYSPTLPALHNHILNRTLQPILPTKILPEGPNLRP